MAAARPAAEARPAARARPPAATTPGRVQEADAPPPFVLKDRRFWARDDAEQPPADAAAPARAAAAPTGAAPARADDDAAGRAAEPVIEAGAAAEGDAAAGAAAPPPVDPAIAALEQQLAAKEARLQATLTQYRDAVAEFDDVRARLRRDVQRDVAAGRRAFLAEMLEVLDNLDRAVASASEDPEAAAGALFAGVTMVREQFLLKLAAMEVRPAPGVGQPFDPERFEAVAMVPVADPAQDGTIVGVMRTCYLIGEETLRHGMAAVGKHQG